MSGPLNSVYSTTLAWLGLAAICVAPAIIAAIYGRGRHVIGAALCSFFAVLLLIPIVNGWLLLFMARGGLPLPVYLYAARFSIGLAMLSTVLMVFAIWQQRRHGEKE